MALTEIRGSSVLILGYGREGQAVHRFLDALAPELEIAIADRVAAEPLEGLSTPVAIHAGDSYLTHCSRYPTIIRSPGVPLILPELVSARAAGVHLTSVMNLFFSLMKGVAVGITGTKGKSTTSSLIRDMLARTRPDVRLVGNIGEPALNRLAGAGSETVFVIELSSFQLEDLRYSPDVGVLLPIVPEHLDHHGSFEAYVRAKHMMFALQQETSTAIFVDGETPPPGRGRKRLIARSPNLDAWWFADGDSLCHRAPGSNAEPLVVLRRDELPLLGPGNVINVLAAAAAADALGVPSEEIAAAVKAFAPLEHRLERVGTFGGITFYNDSLSTIPQAAANALEGLGSDVQTLILGGHDRGIDYRPLVAALSEKGPSLRSLILFPVTGERIWELVQAAGSTLRPYFVTTMEQAVRTAYEVTDPGKVCLLSPAASSLNLFRDYRDRGEQFKRWVRILAPS